jgi:hypothetical protein
VASLKDILPLILAGGAGAVSPQGADVFNNILRQKRIGEQQDRQERDSEERLTLARMASDRAGRAETRAETNAEGVISFRDMQKGRFKKEDERLERIRKSETKLIDYYRSEYPELAASGALDDITEKKHADAIIESFGAPTIEDQMDQLEVIRGRGLSGSLPLEGGGRVGVGLPGQPKAGKEPIEFTKVIGAGIVLRGQDAILKAEADLEQAQIAMTAASDPNGITEPTEAGIAAAEAKVRAKQAALQRAHAEIPQQLREANATEDEVDQLMNPQGSPVDPTQSVASHAVTPEEKAREQFFKNNPDVSPDTVLLGDL